MTAVAEYDLPARCTHGKRDYHIAFGGQGGIDCCEICFDKADITLVSMFLRANNNTWLKAHAQAEWLLAEKDALVDQLRETIEMLESEGEFLNAR